MLASLAQQDFTWKWYLDVGTAIAITMFINVFAAMLVALGSGLAVVWC